MNIERLKYWVEEIGSTQGVLDALKEEGDILSIIVNTEESENTIETYPNRLKPAIIKHLKEKLKNFEVELKKEVNKK